MKYKFFTLIILPLFLMISCKKRTINENTITPNQLEHQIKNGEKKYNMSGEKVSNNESDPQSYKDFEESIYNKDQPTKNDDYESNNDNDFEYSEFWRKEAFKASKQFLINLVSKQKCNATGFSYFQPNLIRYIGNHGYRVKIRCSFDCYQNSGHRKYFWVEAYYHGNNQWNVILIDQKYDD
jgi:hypothetical protein